MQQWRPDEQLIPAMLAGRCTRRYTDLSEPDRAWVVAGLTEAGWTAEKIREHLGCSLRTVRVVKADPAAAISTAFQAEIEAFINETRLLRSELARMTALAEAEAASAARARKQLNRVLVGAGECSKGHPMTHYNVWTDRNNRRWCRTCHRERQAEHRARKKEFAS